MNKLIALFAMMMSAGLVQANPFTITIDDFSTSQGPISDTLDDSNAVTSSGFRFMSINLLPNPVQPIRNTLQASYGILDIANGSGDDSEVTLEWSISPNLVPANAYNVNFSSLVLESDGNPANVVFSLDSTTLLSSAIAANTLNLPINFPISSTLISTGGTLSMVLNGAPGWDLSMDNFAIHYSLPVPEPATLALVSLGLLGFGVASRRRKS